MKIKLQIYVQEAFDRFSFWSKYVYDENIPMQESP